MSESDPDFELLKLAANAVANYHDLFDSDLGHDVWWIQAESRFGHWNPLTDDGDALRLAVRLDISISRRAPDDAYVDAHAAGAKHGCFERLGSDPFAATRRAIVRAAAEIGKQRS